MYPYVHMIFKGEDNMAISYQRKCFGHNSIYEENYLIDNYKKREFDLYYSYPEKGVTKDTGILLLIAGFGGHSNSNVFKKMRNQFADKYNLVTIQCDYFGFEFMQSTLDGTLILKKIDLDKLRDSSSPEEFANMFLNNSFNIYSYLESNLTHLNLITLDTILNETQSNFNDMGMMQALDNIVATQEVIKELTSNNLNFNTNKVMIMGNSHGSYLSYLCNSICRGLYTHILDNSAWLFPKYYHSERTVTGGTNNSAVKILFNYNAKFLNTIIEPLDIRDLYNDFFNTCKIVVYHGDNDNLIPEKYKYQAVKNINNLTYNLITKCAVDNICFKSTEHGLNANYLNLFNKFYNEYVKESIPSTKPIFIESPILILDDAICITYKSGLPELTFNDEFYI